MASTAAEALASCLRGERVGDYALDTLASESESEHGTRSLFQELIEPLSDSFSPRLAAAYVDTFSRLLERIEPSLRAETLQRRHAALGVPSINPRRVVILSRVTLGADIAVTSPFLAAAMARYPDAEICFASNAKNFELFSAGGRLRPLELRYGRTALLRDRIRVGMELAGDLDRADTLVIDPDSRLSQLGLLPFGPPERYLFFPSRSYRPETDESMSELASAFLCETLGQESKSFIAPMASGLCPEADVTVSLGVGENPSKRIDDAFETGLIQGLLNQGLRVLLDKGAGGEETARVERIERTCTGPLFTWQGAFAPFAAAIATSRLYIGYDSAGQHAAAACGTLQITVFAGAPSAKFLARWRPAGPQSTVLTPAPDTLARIIAISSNVCL